MLLAHSAKKIFDGDRWFDDHVIISKGNVVIDIIPVQGVEKSIQTIQYSGFLVPGFVDLQIYGAGGKLFSQHLSIDSLETLTKANKEAGTLYCLPTIATNSSEVIRKAIDVVRQYINEGRQGIGGIHLEGPWINPAKTGAHLEEFIKSPTVDEVREILDHGKGIIKMITVAPEILSDEILHMLTSSGAVISLGHSNADFQQATRAFSEGIKTVTHLFNAMPALHHREPGIVGAVFNHGRVKASIIPDGIHVDYGVVRIAHTVMNDRLYVITDAVTDTNEGPYRHKLVKDRYEANGVLSGSALTMGRAVKNLIQHAGISIEEALRMCSLYPARLMNLDDQYGRIYKGGPTNFVSISLSD